jgi:hypothetical protein
MSESTISTDEIADLCRRISVCYELSELLDRVPEDAEKKLMDPALKAEPELLGLIYQMKSVAARFAEIETEIKDRIIAASWKHVEARYGVAKGDLVDLTDFMVGGCTFVVDSALPETYIGWRCDYPDTFEHFTISGPSLLASGKTGKRRHSLDTRHAIWEKIRITKRQLHENTPRTERRRKFCSVKVAIRSGVVEWSSC